MRMRTVIAGPPGTIPPHRLQMFYDISHRLLALAVRTEVPAIGKARIGAQLFDERQIAEYGIERVLQWPHRIGIANAQGLTVQECLHRIRHQAVTGPVAATEHVSCARTRDADRAAI